MQGNVEGMWARRKCDYMSQGKGEMGEVCSRGGPGTRGRQKEKEQVVEEEE